MDASLFSDKPAPKYDDSLFSEDPAPKQPGQVESFLRGAANNIPLAPQAAAALAPINPFSEKSNYSDELAHLNEAAKAAKAAHPVTYGAGAVTGAVAPLLIPGAGGVMEAAPFLTGAGLGAANAVSNVDVVKHPKEALSDAALGATIGLGTSYGLGKLFPSASSLENVAKTKGLQSTDIPQGVLKEMSPEEFEGAKDFVMNNNLVGTNKEEVLQRALDRQNEIGQKLGSIGKGTEAEGLTAPYQDHLAAALPLEQKAGEYAGLANREAKSLARSYKAGAQDVLGLGDNPSWSAIQALKKQYGDLAFKSTGEVKDPAAKDTYFALRDLLQKITDQAKNNPGLTDEYRQALSDYHSIDPVIEGLEKAVGKERAGEMGHGAGHGFLPRLIRSLPGQSNPAINLATAAGATMISPHIGPLMALPTLTNPAIQSKVASTLAQNLPKIEKMTQQELIDYLTSKFGKKGG